MRRIAPLHRILLIALLVPPLVAGAGSAFCIADDDPPSGASFTLHSETISTSEIELVPPGADPAADRSIRLHQVGNPLRRPPVPDLSREGVHEFPGRLSLEVPPPGLKLGETWAPPGIYRLSLATDGFEPRLRARPLAPGRDLDIPVESGALTAPAGRFHAFLGVRSIERERIGYLSMRWGVLLLETTLAVPPIEKTRVAGWTLRSTPIEGALAEVVYLGSLEPNAEGSGVREARWMRGESEPRLRLESHRRRRLFALRRESIARADRLNGLARSAAEGEDETTSDRLARLADSLEERAAQIERQLSALAGSGLEILGTSRPAQGERTTVTLVEREGTVRLIVESPAGGAEFPLP